MQHRSELARATELAAFLLLGSAFVQTQALPIQWVNALNPYWYWRALRASVATR